MRWRFIKFVAASSTLRKAYADFGIRCGGNAGVSVHGFRFVRADGFQAHDVQAASGGLGEVAAGQLAPQRSTNPAVLQAMTGPTFDVAYAQEQAADHVVGVALFQSAAQSSLDPELRTFAQKHLPVLQRHLQTLTSLMTSLATAR
jgi:putative membrane protein